MRRGKKESVLVTGGAGFIGCHVAKRLMELGYTVVIVDNFNKYYDPILKRRRITEFLKGFSFLLHRVDLKNYSRLRSVFKRTKIDFICHLAAQAGVRYSLENPFLYEEANLKGTLNLLECAREFDVKGFIFASSSSVYGENQKIPFSESDKTERPLSLYAATKKATELLIYSYHSLYKFPSTGLRYFTVYGPWGRPDMALFKFTKNILEDKPIEIYNYGKMTRAFTYIDDIADGTVKAIEKNYTWEIFNLGFGKPVSLGRFIRVIEKSLGKKAKKKYLPLQKGDVSETYADIRKARKYLKWQPRTPVEEGVKKFVEWYKVYYRIKDDL